MAGFDSFILDAVSGEEWKRFHREKADEKRRTRNAPENLRRANLIRCVFPPWCQRSITAGGQKKRQNMTSEGNR